MKKLKAMNTIKSIVLWSCRLCLIFCLFETFNFLYLGKSFNFWWVVATGVLFGVSVLLSIVIKKVAEIVKEEIRIKNLHKAAGTAKFSDRVNRAYKQKPVRK